MSRCVCMEATWGVEGRRETRDREANERAPAVVRVVRTSLSPEEQRRGLGRADRCLNLQDATPAGYLGGYDSQNNSYICAWGGNTGA